MVNYLVHEASIISGVAYVVSKTNNAVYLAYIKVLTYRNISLQVQTWKIFVILSTLLNYVFAAAGPMGYLDERDSSDNYTTVESFADLGAGELDVGELYVDLSLQKAIFVKDIIEHESNSTKRYNCPLRTVVYEQYQVARHGTWWSRWEQATGKLYCDNNPDGASLARGIEWTIGYSIAADIGISIGSVIAAMAGIGISIDRSTTNTCQAQCSCQISNPACIWEQSLFTWSDTQKQKCTRFENCDGGYVHCGAWSGYQRTNAPYKKADCRSYNFGCSHGSGCN